MNNRNRILKLILFKDCVVFKTVYEEDTVVGLNTIQKMVNTWKSKDIFSNTVQVSFVEKNHDRKSDER
jgi:ABC-type polysaccharide transport system permease subunit